MPEQEKDHRTASRWSDLFREEHAAFCQSIAGISMPGERAQYASVLFVRLMFLYFLQQRGLLDGDQQYLRTRLERLHSCGAGRADTFYRRFLLPLFHEGLTRAPSPWSADRNTLLGEMTCLGGGLFHRYDLETSRSCVHIPNEAFARLLGFLDRFRWRLDREQADAGEIGPGVLGLVFEKQGDCKQTGAYYTGEDVTGYIARNTILPFLLDAVARQCPGAFRPAGPVWRLLSAHPDRYLHAALRHGVDLPLPAAIAAGLDDVSRRGSWNGPAAARFALPTETWREHVARRRRCHALRRRLAAGEIHAVNDLIACNLDIARFARDLLDDCDDPELLRAFRDALQGVSILDPTCGSGAFLLAAIAVLEPLHVACLERMQVFVAGGSGSQGHAFAEEQCRPSRSYFVRESILQRNLYGVDLLPEAVEVCKLRLVLQLAAAVPAGGRLGPLPALAGIRSGNALVGLIASPAASVGSERRGWPPPCSERRGPAPPLAASPPWLESQRPFHWFAEFPEIVDRGGFDVIVGNPPYVAYKDVRDTYQVHGLETLVCGDLYACVVERAYGLLRRGGRLGVLVPVSLFGTDGFAPLQQLTLRTLNPLWVSSFANRPAQLFAGAQKRLTVLLGACHPGPEPVIFTTSYLRWHKQERPTLFTARLSYVRRPSSFQVFPASLEKLGSDLEVAAFSRFSRAAPRLERCAKGRSERRGWPPPSGRRGPAPPLATPRYLRLPTAPNGEERSRPVIYYTRKFGYFLAFLDRVPRMVETGTGTARLPSELHTLACRSPFEQRCRLAALSSSTFFWFWNVLSDCRNLNRRELLAFPFDPAEMAAGLAGELAGVAGRYLRALRRTSYQMTKGELRIETFDYAACKPLLDEIDRILAAYYGFTDEELDFIINYDIKYRTREKRSKRVSNA